MQKHFYTVFFIAFSVAVLSLTFLGCEGETESKDCSKHYKNKNACEIAIDEKGEKCRYNEATEKCESRSEAQPCEGKDPDKCRDSRACTFNQSKNQCEDANPAIRGRCEAIQTEKTCSDDPTCDYDAQATPSCKTRGGVSQTFYLYEFSEIAPGVGPGKIKSYGRDLHATASSGAGVVYVTGQGDNNAGAGDIATIDRTTNDGATWESVDLTGAGEKPDKTRDHANFAQNVEINHIGSLHNGVIFEEQDPERLIGIILDSDRSKVSIKWSFVDASIGGTKTGMRPLSFFEVEKGDDYFVYAGNVWNKSNISYFKTGALLGNDNKWKSDYKLKGVEIDKSFRFYANRPGGGLLLADREGQIFEMEPSAVGAANPDDRVIGNEGKPVVPSYPYLQHGRDKNGAVKAILLVGNKYLLVGFTRGSNKGGLYKGGLFWGDITKPAAAPNNWKNTIPNDHAVTGMVEDRTKPGRAIISTHKGVIIFDEGQIQEIVANEKIVTPALITANPGNITDKASAKTGFKGTLTNANLKGVAQGKTAIFFFPSENNVQTLKISSASFNR